jgi:hypothetical protein
MEIVPENFRKLTTFPKELKKALAAYDYYYVRYTMEYTIYNSKTSSLKYFKDALKYRWAEEYIAKKQSKKMEKSKEKVEEAQVVIREELPRWEEYLVLDENTRKTLEEKAYEKFLKEAQSPDNKIMRSIFEKSKKPLILKEFKDSLVVSVIINNPKIYQSLSSFMLECLNFFKNNNIKIDTENFMTMFSFMKEYEDEFVHMKYDEKLKKGEINRK